MARVLAGRGVALDDVERYLAPTLRDSDARSLHVARHGAGGGAARAGRPARRESRRFSATMTSMARPAPPCSRNISTIAAARRSSISRIASPKAMGPTPSDARLRRSAARGSSSPSIAASSAMSRSPRPKKLGLDVVVFDHHQAPESAARRAGAGRSQPAGRSFRARLSLRGGRRLYGAGRAQPRAARGGILERARGARPDRRARSGGAGRRRRRRAADRPQPRLGGQGAGA